MHTRRKVVVGATTSALTLGLTALAAPPATSATRAQTGCRLVELPPPPGGFDAGVMDIEVVDGTTIYYGNYQVIEDGEQTQRAVIWRGVDGDPEPIETGLGKAVDIAFELTSTGLVNGRSEALDGAVDSAVNWVLDLRTKQLTVLDPNRGAATDATVLARRVNDSGQLAGYDVTGVGGGSWHRNGVRAVGWASPASPAVRLAATGSSSYAEGINAHGDRSGLIAKTKLPGVPHWTSYDPTLWRANGTVTTMARIGAYDAIPWEVKDDLSAGGEGFWGGNVNSGHMEAVYWPSPEQAVGLGVLPGGGYSRVFGLDEGGWAVGFADQLADDPDDPYAWRGGAYTRSFLYIHGQTAPGHLRILPSLESVANGDDDWRHWNGTAVHAVNAGLDQAASGSATGVDEDGVATYGATVYVNASQCGVEVATTHDPWGLGETLDEARAESDRVAQGAARGRKG